MVLLVGFRHGSLVVYITKLGNPALLTYTFDSKTTLKGSW